MFCTLEPRFSQIYQKSSWKRKKSTGKESVKCCASFLAVLKKKLWILQILLSTKFWISSSMNFCLCVQSFEQVPDFFHWVIQFKLYRHFAEKCYHLVFFFKCYNVPLCILSLGNILNLGELRFKFHNMSRNFMFVWYVVSDLWFEVK